MVNVETSTSTGTSTISLARPDARLPQSSGSCDPVGTCGLCGDHPPGRPDLAFGVLMLTYAGLVAVALLVFTVWAALPQA